MKIGIYGDSYASANSKEAVKWFELLADKLKTGQPIKKPWWKLFGKEIDIKPVDIELTIYSRAGSSFFYTYQKFLQHHADNDLNIVLATGSGRYPHVVSVQNRDFVITSEPHVEQIVKMLDGKITVSDMRKLADVKAWFRASKGEFNITMQELMLEKIEKLHSNTLYYPCFADSFSKERFKSYELDQNFNVMHTMWHRQLELLGLSSDSIGLAETNNLCGHLGPEFNEFFAEMLYKRIQTGKWDHSGLLDITLTKPLEFYYKLD